MRSKLFLFVALLPLPAFSQLQLLIFNGTTETPVGATADVGTAAPGDTIEMRFRAKNTGNAAVTLQTISIAGAGFSISSAPSIPYIVAPGSEAEIRIAFHPTSTGTYSAFLQVNSISVTLRGTAAVAAILTLAGSSTPLANGAVIDFGSVQRGSGQRQSFTLTNPGASTLTVTSLAVSGTGFRGPIGTSDSIQLAPGQSASFQVAFEPQSGQAAKGALTLDQRSFTLIGQGLDPPLPSASIVLNSSIGASAQQNSLSIPLASASQVNGTGTLTMEFHSSVNGVADDPAIQFLSGPKRTATVNIAVGDTVAKFGAQSSAAFQTGTTAGTIIFTLTLPNATQQASLTISPAAVSIDTATGVRRVSDLDVSLTGFDNTYSASTLAFTFYDKSGAVLRPGVIQADATPQFHQYFSATTTGGAFALRATFPVTGDASQVAGVDVQLTNSAGVVKTQRISF